MYGQVRVACEVSLTLQDLDEGFQQGKMITEAGKCS